MTFLILGLVVFLGAHSLRIFAEPWRQAQVERLGEKKWKGLFSLASLAGLVLVIWGFGVARQQPVVLWASPTWTRHVAAALMLVTFVLLVAAKVPGNGIKARLHHPMVLGVKTWAVAHLIANNTLADVVLFGSFLAWAVVDFSSSRARDRATGTVYPPAIQGRTLRVVVVGTVAWAVFAFWLHGWLIGVRPFG